MPPHAAVDESVESVKHARKQSAAGLVNAVLRRIGELIRLRGPHVVFGCLCRSGCCRAGMRSLARLPASVLLWSFCNNPRRGFAILRLMPS